MLAQSGWPPTSMLTALELFMYFDYVMHALPGGGAGGGVQKKGGAVVLGRWLTLAKKIYEEAWLSDSTLL